MSISEPLTAAPAGVPEGPIKEREGSAFAVLLTLAALGQFVAILTPVLVTLPLKIQQIVGVEQQAGAFGLVAAVGAVFAIICYPLAGRLSDRTTSRFGARRPWILIGAVGGVLSLYIIATATDLVQVIIGWCLVEIFINSAEAALLATVADQVPTSRRGAVSGLFGISMPIALILGTMIVNGIQGDVLRFVIPGVVMVVTSVLFCIVLRDTRVDATRLRRFSWLEFGKSFVFNPKKNPDFGWVWISRFAVMFGYSGISTYLVYFLGDRFGLEGGALTGLLVANSLAQGIATIVASFLFGFVSDRLRRRRAFVFGGGVVLALGLLLIAFAPAPEWVVVGAAVLGFGGGAYLSVDLALATEVLPNKADAGKDLGLLNTTNALPQSIAPAIAPSIIALGVAISFNGYQLLYLVAGAVALVGAIVIWNVRGTR